ncbi:MAG: hypothetical protein JSV89_14635 [Spirochaetaceae bacterium]|nr:MAG: hypothetical protein JSV89_14635 [Spirochaetaceae bacterium]
MVSRSAARGAAVNRSAARLVCLFPLMFLLLFSCATLPPSQEEAHWMGVLPPLSPDSLYASVDVASSRSLLKILAATAGSELEQLERLTAKLSRVHTRIRLAQGEPPDFAMIALGDLTSGSVARRLDLDPAWERVQLERMPGRGFTSTHWSYRTYWRKGNLQVAVPQRSVLLASGGDPAGAETLLRRFHAPGSDRLPAEVSAELEGADLFFYLPDPLALAAISLSASSAQDPAVVFQRLPIRQLWISAAGSGAAGGEDYELEVVFLLSEVENPRAVETLLRLMLTLWMRKVQAEDPVGKLKAATIRTDGGSARIESLTLSPAELASFFQILLPVNLVTGQQP